ncbi:hypothetical protein SBA3_1010030 [Candidatus Sulfopaludibacter sp. SbA3]|nr:hypothetical protein SBA3_1010030 [Candidatus Sulfopaludibacter sp. SbA3]
MTGGYRRSYQVLPESQTSNAIDCVGRIASFDRRQDRRRYQVSRESQTSDATGCVGRIASLTGGKTAGVTRFRGSHRLATPPTASGVSRV